MVPEVERSGHGLAGLSLRASLGWNQGGGKAPVLLQSVPRSSRLRDFHPSHMEDCGHRFPAGSLPHGLHRQLTRGSLLSSKSRSKSSHDSARPTPHPPVIPLYLTQSQLISNLSYIYKDPFCQTMWHHHGSGAATGPASRGRTCYKGWVTVFSARNNSTDRPAVRSL